MWWLSGWCWLSPSPPPAVWLVGAEEPAWWAWGMRGQQKVGRMLQPGADYACGLPLPGTARCPLPIPPAGWALSRTMWESQNAAVLGGDKAEIPAQVPSVSCSPSWGRLPAGSSKQTVRFLREARAGRASGWISLPWEKGSEWCHGQGKCQEEVGSSWLCGTQGVSGPLSSGWALTQPAR